MLRGMRSKVAIDKDNCIKQFIPHIEDINEIEKRVVALNNFASKNKDYKPVVEAYRVLMSNAHTALIRR